MAQKGRKPTKLDDERVTALLTALRGGNYFEHACAYANIAPSTAYRWIERGETEQSRLAQGLDPDPQETVYLELCNAIQKARADAIVANVTIVQQAARNGTWQAAAWWLERSMPNQYGRRLQAEVRTTNELDADIDGDINRIIAYLDEVDQSRALEVGSGTSETGTDSAEE